MSPSTLLGLGLALLLIVGLWWLSWELERQARRYIMRRERERMSEWDAEKKRGDS